MKRTVFLLVFAVAVALSAQDTTAITFRIPTSRIPAIIEAMKGLYPIPQINTGTAENPIWQNKFTDAQWPKECIRQWVIKQVSRRGEKIAKEAVEAPYDTTLIK